MLEALDYAAGGDSDEARETGILKETERPSKAPTDPQHRVWYYTVLTVLICTDTIQYYPAELGRSQMKPVDLGVWCAWLPGRFRWLLRLSTVPSRTQWKQGLDVSVHHWRPWDVNVGNHWLVCRPLESGSRDDVPKVPLGNGVQHAVLGIPRAPGDWRHLGRLTVSLSLISLY